MTALELNRRAELTVATKTERRCGRVADNSTRTFSLSFSKGAKSVLGGGPFVVRSRDHGRAVEHHLRVQRDSPPCLGCWLRHRGLSRQFHWIGHHAHARRDCCPSAQHLARHVCLDRWSLLLPRRCLVAF